MDYWNSLLTEKSWNILQDMRKKYDFILIGGWAAYLWAKLHKSKDVDIALKDIKHLEKFKKDFTLNKNDSLHKYEIKIEEIDIDIYVPFFSKLAVPVEALKDYIAKVEGFDTVLPEVLLILKQGAEKDRENSVKGEKDRIDIISLVFFSNINFKKYFDLLEKFNLKDFENRLKSIVINFKGYEILGLNPRQFKLKKKEFLKSWQISK